MATQRNKVAVCTLCFREKAGKPGRNCVPEQWVHEGCIAQVYWWGYKDPDKGHCPFSGSMFSHYSVQRIYIFNCAYVQSKITFVEQKLGHGYSRMQSGWSIWLQWLLILKDSFVMGLMNDMVCNMGCWVDYTCPAMWIVPTIPSLILKSNWWRSILYPWYYQTNCTGRGCLWSFFFPMVL